MMTLTFWALLELYFTCAFSNGGAGSEQSCSVGVDHADKYLINIDSLAQHFSLDSTNSGKLLAVESGHYIRHG